MLGFVSDASARIASVASGGNVEGLVHVGLRRDGCCGLGDRAAPVSRCESVGPDDVILAVALGRALGRTWGGCSAGGWSAGGWSAVGVADIAGDSWLLVVAAVQANPFVLCAVDPAGVVVLDGFAHASYAGGGGRHCGE